MIANVEKLFNFYSKVDQIIFQEHMIMFLQIVRLIKFVKAKMGRKIKTCTPLKSKITRVAHMFHYIMVTMPSKYTIVQKI